MDTPNPPEPGRVNSAEDLAIPGLTDEEADAFVDAVDGRGPVVGEGVPVRAADVADAWVDGFVADTLGDYGEVRVSDSADLARHVLRGLSEAAGGGDFAMVDGVLCSALKMRTWPSGNYELSAGPVLGEASDG